MQAAIMYGVPSSSPKANPACIQLVVSEITKAPWVEDTFRDKVAEIRTAAGLRVELQMRDLRRTGLTELGDVGATTHELQAFSGHTSLEVMATYVRPTEAGATSAFRKRARARKASKKGTE